LSSFETADARERQTSSRADGDSLWLAPESGWLSTALKPRHDDHGTVLIPNCPFRRLAKLQPAVVCPMRPH
jgi:hypothetical protein